MLADLLGGRKVLVFTQSLVVIGGLAALVIVTMPSDNVSEALIALAALSTPILAQLIAFVTGNVKEHQVKAGVGQLEVSPATAVDSDGDGEVG